MSELVVNLSEGKIRGIVGKNFHEEVIYKFLGVPYAKPPIGELRFKAPQPVDPWEGIKDATKDGNASYNRDIIHEQGKDVQGGEDCLVLNVFTKNIEERDNLKPVMVYIHGGGFVMGCNKSEIYGPEFLLTEDIVLVVINYRLGLLGFLSLEDETLDVPGNAALKDQTLALKWVQRNIKCFGGDPNNVTIFGESAGSGSVHFHVLSQSSKGLFHKAILQSGTALANWAICSSSGPIVATALGKKEDTTDKELLSILQNMSGKEIFAIQEKILDPLVFGTQRPFGPVVEKPNPSAFLTTHPIEVIRTGEFNHVPLFIGYNSHEGLLLEILRKMIPNFDDLYTYQATIPWILKANNEQVKQIEELMSNFYSKVLEEQRRKDMVMMDVVFFSTVVAAIVNHLKTSKCPIYVYRISVDCQRNFLKHTHNFQAMEGTCHADELGFLWNIQSLPNIEQNTLESLTVQRFVKLWTNFAKSGSPTSSNDLGVTLSPVSHKNPIPVLNIGEKLTVLKDLPERERIDFWKKIFSLSAETADYL